MQREKLRKFTDKALENLKVKRKKAMEREKRLNDGSTRMYVEGALRIAVGYGAAYAVSRVLGLRDLAILFGFIGGVGAFSGPLLYAMGDPIRIWRRTKILENYKDELGLTPEKVKEISHDVVKALRKALPRGPERNELLSEVKRELEVAKGPTGVRRALDELMGVREAAWKVVEMAKSAQELSVKEMVDLSGLKIRLARVASEGLGLSSSEAEKLGIPDLNERASNMVRRILGEISEEPSVGDKPNEQQRKAQPTMTRTVIGQKPEVGEISSKPTQSAQQTQPINGDFGKY